jgi:hypothetical protein
MEVVIWDRGRSEAVHGGGGCGRTTGLLGKDDLYALFPHSLSPELELLKSLWGLGTEEK